MSTALILEIMNNSNEWVERTDDFRGGSCSMGLYGQRYAYPRPGQAVLTMDNRSKTYSPAQAVGIDTGAIDIMRRVRIRNADGTSGYYLMTKTTGIVDSSGGAVTPAVQNGTHPSASLNFWYAQRITATASGTCYAISFSRLALAGATGTAYIEVYSDSAGVPGTLQSSQIIASTQSTQVYIPPFSITNGTTYHVVVRTTTTTLSLQVDEVDAGYTFNYKISTNQGSSWLTTPTHPLNFGLVIGGGHIKQQVSSSSTAADVYVLSWDAWAEFDSLANTDYVRIVTSAESCALYTPSYTNRRTTYTLTFTTVQNATTVMALFSRITSPSSSTAAAIYYDNITLKKNGGSNLLVNGDFATGATTSWSTVVNSPATVTLSTVGDGDIIFNGFIKSITPAQGLYSDDQNARYCTLTCVDWVQILSDQTGIFLLQENKTADQLITYALSFLQTGSFNATIPGRLFDTGKTTVQEAFDTYTNNNPQHSSLLDAIKSAAGDEFGRFWIDRDGTARFKNRDFFPLLQIGTAALSLSDSTGDKAWTTIQGEPSKSEDKNDDLLVNHAIVVYRPRNTSGASTTILATATNSGPLTVPAKKPNGDPGQLNVTLTYVDSSGKVIGGKSVITPVASTDYLAFDDQAGRGYNYTGTSYLTVTNVVKGASQTTMTFNNTATGALYLTLLQVRGTPIYTYDPITIEASDTTSINKYQERPYKKSLDFANDQSYVTSFANYMVNMYKYPLFQYGGVRVDNKDSVNGVSLLSLDMLDIVSITDSSNNVTAMKHFITGFEYEFAPINNTIQVKSVNIMLERHDMVTNWFLLDHATYGQLDNNVLYI